MATQTSSKALGSLGNYELLLEVGRGSFGLVYRARHWETGRIVAIKVAPPLLARNPMLAKRFQQECLLASKIDHPNIVRVLEYYIGQGDPFLVMELVEGISLGEWVERDGAIPEAVAVPLMVQACQGLEQIHSLGLLHRDIKPDNILATPEGVAKIVDLGLAKNIDTGIELTKTGTGLGTPNFIAPEQFRNAKNVDLRCDIYALGATLYQMVTGVLPFADTNPVNILVRKLKGDLVPPQQIVPGLSERVVNTILRALSIDPEQRFTSCWEFAASLVDTTVGLGPEFDRLSETADMWYVHFEGKDGKRNRAMGHAAGLGRAAAQGKLGDVTRVRAARSMAGPFRRLAEFPALVALVQHENPGAAVVSELSSLPDALRPAQCSCIADTIADLDVEDSPEPVPVALESATSHPTASNFVRSETFQLEDENKQKTVAAEISPGVVRPLSEHPLPSGQGKGFLSGASVALTSAGGNESLGWWAATLILLLIGAATFFAGHYLVTVLP